MPPKAVRAHLIAGGHYHDIDFARLALLTLLAEHPDIRTSVSQDYDCSRALEESDFLVTYTCNVTPAVERVDDLRRFVEHGGRWLALHGTNSILAQNDSGRWYAPEDNTGFVELLGSQFAAHPPISPYVVEPTKPEDPLVAGIGAFEVEGGDELYYMRMFGEVEVILDATAQGPARGFVERDWPTGARHPVLYRKRVGRGEIVYFTLGHRRSHYDMAPLIDFYPQIEKGAWEINPYMDILRRSIDWARGALG
ncbi:MAG: ThuA domain-containing protein [Alphaproteobacteria bacterium]|nr:ThuA domain-containing protein [Alphaproteobacteria bacterium]